MNRPRQQRDWIARALGRAGVLSSDEDEINHAIASGRVQVNGKTVRQPLTPWDPQQRVTVDGRNVQLDVLARVLMLHKPKGCVTSTVDTEGRPTVFDVLRRTLSAPLIKFRWHAVGRLDVDTTGLLLFTNDEKVVAHVTSPEIALAKVYVATVQGEVWDNKLRQLEKGITLNDGPAKALRARRREDGQIEIHLTEGRHHQVKRMLGAVGLPVRALHRAAIGHVRLNLEEGESRELTTDEVREGLSFPV